MEIDKRFDVARCQIVETEMSDLKQLSFVSCDCTITTIRKLENLESLHFRSDCLVPIRVMEEISNSFENLIELRFPNIPSGFIPLVIRNHPRIQGKLSSCLQCLRREDKTTKQWQNYNANIQTKAPIKGAKYHNTYHKFLPSSWCQEGLISLNVSFATDYQKWLTDTVNYNCTLRTKQNWFLVFGNGWTLLTKKSLLMFLLRQMLIQ